MEKNTALSKLVLVAIFAITIIYFGFWGNEWVNYILSTMYSVDTGSTFYDLFIGLVAMISSVPLFVGAAMAWKSRENSVTWLTIGSYGFIAKNVLEILNIVFKLSLLPSVTAVNIRSASADIGEQLFQIAFWVFVMVYFKKEIFGNKETVSVVGTQ